MYKYKYVNIKRAFVCIYEWRILMTQNDRTQKGRTQKDRTQKDQSPSLIALMILILVFSWIFTLFALPLFFPERGSCDITISDGNTSFPESGVIGWSVDVRAPVFMIAPCTIEAKAGNGVFDTGKASAYAVYGSGNKETVIRIPAVDENTIPCEKCPMMKFSVPSHYRGKKLTRVYGDLPAETEESQFALIMNVRAPTAPVFMMPFIVFRNTEGQTEDGGLLAQEYVLMDKNDDK